ncbi:MAG: hypothetical protein HKN87_10900 [Saprospiraceae bacterium]|nr:hypothetical protein [Saprospiraceae bacterium]
MTVSLSESIEDIFDDVKDALVGNARRESFLQFAEKYDLSYQKRMRSTELDLAVLTLNFFGKRKKQRLKNVLTSYDQKTASKLLIFDVHRSKTPKKKTTCVLLESDLLNLPRYCFRPKRSVEKVTALFKANQRSLARYPELQRSMVLEAKHMEYMQRYLTEQLADMILSNKATTIEGIDDWLLIYQEDKRVEVSDLLSFRSYAIALAEILLFDHSNDLV